MNEPSDHPVSEPPPTTRRPPLIFLGTYLGGAILLAVLFDLMSGEPGVFLMVLGFALVFLPWGLPRAILLVAEALPGLPPELFSDPGRDLWPENPLLQALIVFSYASLVGLMIWGSLTKEQKTFRRAYLAFLFLLILNVGGCVLIP